MPSRIVREGIISSARINALSPMAEILYRRLMSVADDYGRFYAEPATIRGACWPTCPNKISEDEIAEQLGELCAGDQPLVLRYTISDIQYLQLDGFGQQIRSKSKFPEPDGTFRKAKGFIYFIQATESKRIKIGYAEDPQRRLRTLQTGSQEILALLGCFPGTLADEKHIQADLIQFRQSGEWFTDCARIVSIVKSRCEQSDISSQSDCEQFASTSRSRISESKALADLADCPPVAGTNAEAPLEIQRRPKRPPLAIDGTAISTRFDEWFDGWSRLRGTANRLQAQGAWISVARAEWERDIFECTNSYLMSSQVSDGRGFNPENFIFQQAKDAFRARWPPKMVQPPQNQGTTKYLKVD